MRTRSKSPTCLVRPAVARWLAILVFSAATLPAATVEAQAKAAVTMPAAGTPVRKAVLDALRRHLKTRAVFKVGHLAVSGSHAFFRGGEVVPDGDNLQETDLFVEALLERSRTGRWRVVHLWNLADESETSLHQAFLANLRRAMREKALPAALLPDDLRPTGSG